ncbi:kinase-like domain-containing protein, partial [Microdochium bolleyi]
EVICYPTMQDIGHLHCRLVHERDLVFESHLSGFVYKVRHAKRVLIKKEIPRQDTVDGFLYEVEVLDKLRASPNIINLYGVVIDDADHVKALLVDFAEQGSLVDVIRYTTEYGGSIDWRLRERWARQIVRGVSDAHETGFVHANLTLSSIVIDESQSARVINFDRRRCPPEWEAPEASTPTEYSRRMWMYIGVKFDLFQLGMILWALATMECEPEARR